MEVNIANINITITHDMLAFATYISFVDNVPVARTVKINDVIIVDLDDEDTVIGIETFLIGTPIPISKIKEMFNFPPNVVYLLSAINFV